MEENFSGQLHAGQFKINFRKLVITGALLIGILFLLLKVAELQTILTTLQQGDWHFILLAVAVESIWMISVAVAYRFIYQSFGIHESVPKLLLLSMATNFISVVAPTGVSGWAVMAARARQKGYSQTGAVISGFLFVLLDYFSFLCFLAVGLLVLFEQQELEVAELAASACLFVLAVGLLAFIYIGMRKPDKLRCSFARIARLSNRLLFPFAHREILSEARAISLADEAANDLQILSQHPKSLLMPAALTLWTKGLLVAVLFLMFLSFNVPFSLADVIASFSMGYLFMIVSPTPSGLGVIEGTLPLVISSLHVPLGAAAVVALSYRGITFWLPLLFGMIAFHRLLRQQKIEKV
jgi:uncharacterized protein (TIRG00374 family)